MKASIEKANVENNTVAEVEEAKVATTEAVKENADVVKATGKGLWKIIKAFFKKESK